MEDDESENSEDFFDEDFDKFLDENAHLTDEEIENYVKEYYKDIDYLIDSALHDENKKRTYSRTCQSSLAATLSEFLSSFILIGFDADGNPIEITKSASTKDEFAMSEFLRTFYIKYFSKDYLE
jgi:hypothetical protein